MGPFFSVSARPLLIRGMDGDIGEDEDANDHTGRPEEGQHPLLEWTTLFLFTFSLQLLHNL